MFNNDVLGRIFNLLDFHAFIAASLTSRQFSAVAHHFAEDNKLITLADLLEKGYGLWGSPPSTLQYNLITAFTCPCGQSAWDIVTSCKCLVTCSVLSCKRRLPLSLTSCLDHLGS